MLNRNSHIPLYIQLADLLRKQIYQGIIQPGDKLPSEAEMIKSYQLGRLTIREALSKLANEGLVEKQHGKGTYCKSVQMSKKRLTVDVLLNMTDTYFLPYYLHSICEVLEGYDVVVTVNDTKGSTENIVMLLEKILENGSDGVLIQPSPKVEADNEKINTLTSELIKSGIPYIMIDCAYSNVPQSYVIVNEKKVGILAAEYFKKLNHKSLCMICSNDLKDSLQRLEGFKQNLDIEPYIIHYDNNLDESVKNMLKTRPDITGVFCYNDLVARKLLRSLKKLGVNVPNDISIISVDDTIIATTVTPSLTSVAHPKDILGKTAAKALLDVISGDAPWPYTKVFEPSLIERKSCKKL